MTRPLAALAALVIVLSLAAPMHPAQAAPGGGAARQGEAAILLVAFGTSVAEARGAYDHLEARVRQAFPSHEVRWAWTSEKVRSKVARAQGVRVPSPAEALERMARDGFARVAVQSLHVIPGEEYGELVQAVRETCAPRGMQVRLGAPLLADAADIAAAATAIAATLPADRSPGEAVVLMGHGTHHPADVLYTALQHALALRDPHTLVGTVAGSPAFEDVLAGLKTRRARSVVLVPLMAVAGTHAREDMAGQGPDSWQTRLAAAGFRVRSVLEGMAGQDAFADIWIGHLRSALGRFQATHAAHAIKNRPLHNNYE